MSEQSILICRACTYPLGLRWPMRRGGTDGGCQNCGNDTHLGEFSAQDGHGIISRQAARIAELERENAALRAELNMFREKLSDFSQEQFDRANHLDM